MSSVPKSSGEGGNTTSPSPKKGWCFTINNYTANDIKLIEEFQTNYDFIYGIEKGENGTPHLQGYIHLHEKQRFSNIKSWLPRAHLEARKGSIMQAVDYCKKDGDYYTNNARWKKKTSIEIPIPEIHGWQLEIDNIIQNPPHARRIYWRWENIGNYGKSTMIKYACLKFNAICLSGKAGDMKYGIMMYYKKWNRYPKTIMIDIPRSVDIDFLSYTGIEEIKNGCFFCGKYESDMVIMPIPHIIIFSNEEPNVDKLSADRWDIKNIRE